MSGDLVTFLKPNSIPRRPHVTKTLDISVTPPVKTAAVLCRYWIPEVTKVSSLDDLAAEFVNRQDCIRIYGCPDHPNRVVERRKRFFHAAPGYHIHLIDCDKWVIPTFRPTSPKEVATAIRQGLQDKGLHFLEEAKLLVVLSAGQEACKTNTFNGHIYFQFNSPVTLDEMETVAKAVNDAAGLKIFDPAVYRLVQPDYYARPRFTGQQKDPIKQRLIFLPGSKVDKEEWTKYKARFYLQQLVFSSNKPVAYPGLRWMEIIDKYCGNPDINEPCMMAAIRMVREHQPNVVNVDAMAKELYARAWAAIRLHGKRGNTSDRAYYNLDKFRGYIKYPLEHPIGTDPASQVTIDNVIRKTQKQAMQIGGTAFLDPNFIKAYDILSKIDAFEAAKLDVVFTKYKVKTQVDKLKKAITSAGNTRRSVLWYNANFKIRFKAMRHGEGIYYQDRNTGQVRKLSPELLNEVKEQLISNTYPVKVPVSSYSDVLLLIQVPTEAEDAVIYERAGWHYDRNCAYYNAGDRTIEVSKDRITELKPLQSPVLWEKPVSAVPINYGGDFYKLIRSLFSLTVTDAATAHAWCVFSLLGWPYRPVLYIEGPPASGKTELARFLCRILDPEFSSVSNTPKDDAGFFDKLSKTQFVVFDNVSQRFDRQWQDALCTMSTGRAASFRRPYGTANEIIMDRSVILTSIQTPNLDADLLSRMLTIQMDGCIKHKYKDFVKLAEQKLPHLRGAVLESAQQILADPPKNVPVREFPMAAIVRHYHSHVNRVKILRNFQDIKWHNAALANPRLLILLIYLNIVNDFEASTHEIQQAFSEWVLKNMRKKYEIFKTPVVIEWYDNFKNPNSIGRLLSLNKQLIESVLNVNLTPIRDAYKRGWKFAKLTVNDII